MRAAARVDAMLTPSGHTRFQKAGEGQDDGEVGPGADGDTHTPSLRTDKSEGGYRYPLPPNPKKRYFITYLGPIADISRYPWTELRFCPLESQELTL